MNPLYPAAMELQSFCRRHNWQFCIIGGLALQRWGRPRATQDVDATLLTGFDHEERFVDALLEEFRSRRPDAREFALTQRVVLLQAANGVFVDLSLAGLPFERRMIARATPFDYAPGVRLVTASAEDLVVTKAFAARLQDWADVEGILIRQRGKLDWEYVRRELAPLCELKDAPQIVDELERMKAEIDAE